MARVTVLKSPDELPAEARTIAEKIVDTRKSLDGPFSVWMHAPEWAERVAHLGTLVRWEGTLELRTRTLAALVVGRHFQAQYVWGIQGVIGAERDVPARPSTRSAMTDRMVYRPRTCRSSTSPGNCCAKTASTKHWRVP